jgi:hypothetical protein
MIYFHIPIGIFAHRSGIFRASTWPARLRSLLSSSGPAASAILQLTLAAAIPFYLAPQLLAIVKKPHLGRVYVTKLLHLRNLQEYIRGIYGELLGPVGSQDVVLSDHETSWLIPSFRGRVLTATHYELFVPEQPVRAQAVRLFFDPHANEQQSEEIIRTYSAKWIVLNPRILTDEVFHSLIRTEAVVRQAGGMVLMRASSWITAAPAPGAKL